LPQPGQVTSFAINGLGERIVKSGNGNSAIEYVYDGTGHLLGEYDNKGQAIEETVYLGDLPVATIDSTGPHYISPDQIGAPHIIADSANSVLWTWAHAHRGDTGPVTAQNFTYNLRFADPVFDAETGVSDDMARDYNVALGR